MNEEHDISFVQFGVMSPEEIQKYAVCKITDTKISTPQSGNLYDPKMGSIDSSLCETCSQSSDMCPGHFGYIELDVKIIHPKFAPIVYSILKCVCYSCSSLLIPPSHFKLFNINDFNSNDTLEWIKKECKKIKSCPNEKCESGVVIWKMTRECIFTVNYSGNEKKVSTDEIYDILRKISNETMYLLGFNKNLSSNKIFMNKDLFVNANIQHRHQIRPEWFILTVLPIAPPCIRPSIVSDIDEKQDDDLTDKYVNICKINSILQNDRKSSFSFFATKKKKNVKLNEFDRKKKEHKLYEEIASLFDNSDKKSLLNGKRPHKCFKQRLNGKNGHIRKNVEGKRVDFSGRTVIDAGPTLKFHQVSVPLLMSTKLTIPVEITSENIDEMNVLFNENKINTIIRNEKSKFRIEIFKKRKLTLNVGDIVERHLQTGDWVIMNRQPTLRIESMNAHEVVISPSPTEKVLRIHLSSCHGYNADFDGDEMNIHVVQSKKANEELKNKMNIIKKINSSQHNQPIAGIVQDGLVGLYFMTLKSTRVSIDLFYDCIMYVETCVDIESLFERAYKYYKDEFTIDNGILKPKRSTLSGRILVSILFPVDFYYEKKIYDKNEISTEQDGHIIIENGILISGDLTKNVLGAKANSIVHILSIEYNYEEAGSFLSNACFLCNKWLSVHSFSFGIDDCLNTKNSKIEEELNNTYKKCDEILNTSKNSKDCETKLHIALNNSISIGQKLAKEGMNGGIKNAMAVCIYSGAKGSYVNCSQITAFLGQQNLMGQRIPKKISNNTRSLPHFDYNENSLEARGFVDRCFIDGLRPTQMFFHAMAGREGLIDTAVKTRDSGYIQRRFVKKMENLKVHIDGTVRDCNNDIVQFSYGTHNFNPKELYYVKGKLFFIDVYRIANRLNSNYEYKNGKNGKKIKLKDVHIDVILMEINTIGYNIKNNEVSTSITMDLQHQLKEYIKDIELYAHSDTLKSFLNIIVQKFIQSRIEPGTMVGIIAALSLGEVGTQITLNSFHSTGRVTKATTTGIPRLNELLNTTKNPKTPSSTIYLNDQIVNDYTKKINTIMKENKNNSQEEYIEEVYNIKKRILEQIQSMYSKFEYTQLKNLLQTNIELKFIRNSNGTVPLSTPVGDGLYIYKEFVYDDSFVKIYNELMENQVPLDQWMCEITLNMKLLFDLNMNIKEVCDVLKFEDKFGNYECIPSPMCIGKIYIFIDFNKVEESALLTLKDKKKLLINEDNWKYFYTRDIIIEYLKEIKICGISSIEKIFPMESQTGEWYLDTQGSNFRSILNLEYVDFTRTTCDNMWEIFETLGIEATRTFLIEEIKKVLCGDGAYVNICHFMILVDSMTRNGSIDGVRRAGIDRSVGPFTKAAFEEVFSNFITSAAFTEVDYMNSVSSNIALGKRCNIG